MNQQLKKEMSLLAEQTGLCLDLEAQMLHGIYNGYQMCILPVAENSLVKNILVSVTRGTEMPSTNELSAFVSSCPFFTKRHQIAGHLIVLETAHAMTLNKDLEKNKSALDELTGFLHQNGYENCCQSCGTPEDIAAYSINGTGRLFCPVCFHQQVDLLEHQRTQKAQIKSSPILGAVGALLGSLVGVIAIVLISQLGYVAAISGIIMGVCTLFGYDKLGKRLDGKGVVISFIIMLLMVFFAENLNWAIEISKVFEANIFDSFRAIPELIQAEAIELSAYSSGLIILYLFTLLGAVPSVYRAFKQRHNLYIARKAENSL